MDTMIELQNCIETSFIINDWLISAIESEVDIGPLLESEILSTKLTKDNLEHPDMWPTYHQEKEQLTKNYKLPFMKLLHDEEAYD